MLSVSPPEHTIVLWVDEKSQIQALDRSQPMLPMRPERFCLSNTPEHPTS